MIIVDALVIYSEYDSRVAILASSIRGEPFIGRHPFYCFSRKLRRIVLTYTQNGSNSAQGSYMNT